MKKDFMNNVSRTFHRVGFKVKKHSPEILVVAGVVGTVVSAVMACKATTKINTILDASKAEIDKIHDARENPNLIEVYSEKDAKKDLTTVYTHTGLQLLKLYGPSVILGTASLTCILTSHNIVRKRNAALAAAYATVDKGFKEYRGRVIERFGNELDRELKYNIKAKEIEETVTAEDGSKKVVKKTVNVADPNFTSDYARFFDETCGAWTKDPEYNLTFLKLQQSYANKKLQEQGYLYLNDVYEMLGMQKSKAGHVVGWIYDKDNQLGDNYVDFGIYDLYDEQKRNFVNGYERSILLDFNVDGNIWELMS